MKKLLSLLLAISLCLSGVILLASCAGKSAYDVAVENGFTGTEAEWIASLNGKDGVDGSINFDTLTFGKDAEGYLTINGWKTNVKVEDIGK